MAGGEKGASMDAVEALLNVPCPEHRPTGTPDDCAVCGTPVAVHAELERLRAVADAAEKWRRAPVRGSKRAAARNRLHEALDALSRPCPAPLTDQAATRRNETGTLRVKGSTPPVLPPAPRR